MAAKGRDIGLGVPTPGDPCTDRHCPFHGHLPVRGAVLEGIVATGSMQRTVVVEREQVVLSPKYERYEKRTGRIAAHAPPCLGVKAGDRVVVAECRPLAKTVSFVVVQNKGAAA